MNKAQSRLFLAVSVIISIVLFQNFKSFDIAFDPKYAINEESRKQHAKEILGKKYNDSTASQFEGETLLSIEVLNLVQRNTPSKYQKNVDKITKAILVESNKYNIDPIFVASIIKTESSFNHLAVGTSGEIGLMQMMPKTGKYIAEKIHMKKYNGAKTLRDPVKNIKIGVAYLNYLREKFDKKAIRYISAYNMGPGNVNKVVNKKSKIPKVYSQRVLKFYESFYKRIYVTQMLKNPYLAQK